MKNIILSLALILSLSISNAQEIVLKKGEEVKELIKGAHYKTSYNVFEKLEGIWEYKTEKETFRVKLKSEKTYVKGADIYIDVVKGVYCYTNDDTECLFDSTERCLSQESSNNDLERGFSYFTFLDVKYNKVGKLKFELLENGTARWTLTDRTMVQGGDWKEGFSVPTDVILTKVE